MLAFREFPVDDKLKVYFELYNVHYRELQFEDVNEDQDKVQKSFREVDHEVVAVDRLLTNHTNDDDENGIDHQ